MKRIVLYPMLAAFLAPIAMFGGEYSLYNRVKRISYLESDPRLNHLMNEFIEQCDAMGKNCSQIASQFPRPVIRWDANVDLDDAIARCMIFSQFNFEYKKVILLHPSVAKYSDNELRSLVWHESLHCLLCRDHTDPEYIRIMRSTALLDEEIEAAGGLDHLLEVELNDDQAPKF